MSVTADVARLTADAPLVMLPVRLETRFHPIGAPTVVRVRIYPDDLLADSHEPALTAAERAAGDRYWAAVAADPGNPQAAPAAWAALLAEYPAPRAAWLVRATDPGAVAPPASRDASWTRAVEARALPDRWFVAGYRFDPVLGRPVEVTRAESGPVVTPLALTLTPDPDDAAGPVPVAGLDVDPAAAWAFDFGRALTAGMAVELPLPATDPLGGFDRVVAVGVAASVPPGETGAVLGRLLDAHHWTNGLAVVPQGTPTNNVTATASGFPPPDPGGAVSYAVELGPTGPGTGGPAADVADLLATLGLTAADVDPRIGDGRPAGHPRAGQRRAAAAMADALWPATIGYFLEQAMAPVFDAATLAAARRYVVDTVHGRGPAPALRVGGTPYGVLPVSSLDRWEPARPGNGLLMARTVRTDSAWPGRVAVAGRADRLVAVARDAAGELHRWAGKGWTPLGVAAAGDPAAAADRDGVVHVVARGEGGALVHARIDGVDRGRASVEVDETARLTGDPAVAAAGARVDVVAAGPNGVLVHRQLLPGGLRRAAWAELDDGEAADPVLAARAEGGLDLVARRRDVVVHRRLAEGPRAPGRWSAWTEVDVAADGPVALAAVEAASRQAPGLVVLVAPARGELAWLAHDTAWSGAERVPGSRGLDRPSAALLRAGLGVVAVTADGEPRQAVAALGPGGVRHWPAWTPLEPAGRAVTLRTGRDVAPDGAVTGGWTDPAALPGGIPDLAGAVALAAADLTGSGRPDLVAAAPRTGGRVGYRAGFELAADGAVTGGWSAVRDVPLPDPAEPAAGCAAALLPGAGGRFDLAVAFVAAAPGAAFYLVGRGLDAAGDVTGGWSGPWQLPFPVGGAFAGAAVVRGRLVVGSVAGGALDVLVSDPLAPDGSAPGWAPPLRVPWPDPVTVAAIAVRGDDLVALVSDAAGTRYAVGAGLGAAGWTLPLPVPAAGGGAAGGRLPGVGLAVPALGARPIVGDSIAGTLRALRDTWLAAARGVPRVGRTGDPDTDLLELLGMDASTREVRVRPVLGAALVDNLAQLYGTSAFGSGSSQAWRQWQAEARKRVDEALRAVGPPAWDPAAGARAWDPRLGRMVAGEDAPRFAHALVALRAGATDVPLSETDPLSPENYVDWLLQTGGDVAEVRRAWRGVVGERPPLLAILLRQALLLEHARVGADLLGLDPVERRERELHGMPVAMATPAGTQVAVPPTVWDRFAAQVPGTGRTVAETIAALWAAPDGPYASYRASLEVLRDLPTAELQRVFAEALDVASHRIDAWVTALAADRLRELRRLQAGNHLAAFGWVEDLRPAEPGRYTATTAGGAAAFVQRDGGGHVHAPSPMHAAAAAVLRSAHLTRSGEDGRRYAVDLSSARVRVARELLAGVREGGALGEVLGARVERGLRRRSATGPPADSLERFVDPLRDRFPLVAGKLPAAGDEAPPAAAAGRAVLDGLTLRTAWRSGAVDLDDVTGGHPATSALRAALEAEVALLDEALDATADLLTADGVHQLVRGNPPAAAASLDALARGVRPPDPDVAQTPRGGTAVTHRVVLVLGPAAADWAATATPRAVLEPAADGWLADLLGNPSTVRCRVRTSVADVTTTRTVTLADLGLRPLDLLALARGGTAELDRRIVWEARRVAAVPLGADDADPQVAVLHVPAPGRDPATERTFPEVLELARAAGTVLGAARPLRPADLVQPHEAGATGSSGVRGAEALVRAEGVRGRMTGLASLLDTAMAGLGPAAGPAPQPPPAAAFAAARDALRAAALLGFPGSFPAGHKARREVDRSELAAQLASVRAEIARRLAAAPAAPAAPAAGATEPERLAAATALVTALLGADAVFLPTLVPTAGAALDQAIAGGPAALGPARAATLRAWTQQVGRVRKPMDAWRRLGLYAETAGRPLALGVAQLPHTAGEPWVGRPGTAVPAGRLSLVLHRHATPAAGDPWSAVLLDEWTELVPNAAELTGIAFHYDDPGAEAPQAVLVAVPPGGTATWDLDTVVAVLHETLDLAKVRAVDAELAGGLGHLLPMTLLAANHAGDTIASDLTRMRVGD